MNGLTAQVARKLAGINYRGIEMRYLFAPFLVALSFLTLLPVGVANPTDAEISRSRGWYPFVGLLYGLMLVGVLWLFVLVPPPFAITLLAAALLTVIPALVNRFLHLDGLMDFCDAMWGGRTVERRLEIMRDSRVGSFAVGRLLLRATRKICRPVQPDAYGRHRSIPAGISGYFPVVHDAPADGVPVRTSAGYRQRVLRR